MLYISFDRCTTHQDVLFFTSAYGRIPFLLTSSLAAKFRSFPTLDARLTVHTVKYVSHVITKPVLVVVYLFSPRGIGRSYT